MKIKEGNNVIIKKRTYMSEDNEEWVRVATQQKEKLKVIKAIPMRGFLVESSRGDRKIFNGSDLREVV